MRQISILMVLLIMNCAIHCSLREQVIQQQLEDLMQQIKGKKVGMLTNPTSVDGTMSPLFNKII
jgi:uncharacterized protein YbbC (DUF1343 family)